MFISSQPSPRVFNTQYGEVSSNRVALSRSTIVSDTIVAIATSIFALAISNSVERTAPGLAILLRLVPVFSGVVWLIRRIVEAPSRDYSDHHRQPYFGGGARASRRQTYSEVVTGQSPAPRGVVVLQPQPQPQQPLVLYPTNNAASQSSGSTLVRQLPDGRGAAGQTAHPSPHQGGGYSSYVAPQPHMPSASHMNPYLSGSGVRSLPDGRGAAGQTAHPSPHQGGGHSHPAPYQSHTHTPSAPPMNSPQSGSGVVREFSETRGGAGQYRR